MAWTISTTRRALAVGLAGAAIAAPALAQNSYNVRVEGRVAKATKITGTSAQLNGFVQNATGQKSRLVFSVGRRAFSTPWSTSRMPRKVSARAAGLKPRTRYVVTGQVQAYVLCRPTKKNRRCAGAIVMKGKRFVIGTAPAGSVSFTTKA